MEITRLRRMFETNVLGSFVCACETLLRMNTRHGSAGQYVDYSASKGNIDTFTTELAKEVAL
jgi:NAD(P)-dependent dehydrogenase (short-subunit alcohol dehydrogenase family)